MTLSAFSTGINTDGARTTVGKSAGTFAWTEDVALNSMGHPCILHHHTLQENKAMPISLKNWLIETVKSINFINSWTLGALSKHFVWWWGRWAWGSSVAYQDPMAAPRKNSVCSFEVSTELLCFSRNSSFTWKINWQINYSCSELDILQIFAKIN